MKFWVGLFLVLAAISGGICYRLHDSLHWKYTVGFAEFGVAIAVICAIFALASLFMAGRESHR